MLTLEKDADGKFITTVNGKGDKSKDLLVEVEFLIFATTFLS